jgi:myo-inositol-1-phosphate synthase
LRAPQIFSSFRSSNNLITYIILGGWDISDTNLGDAMKRADVFDHDLQQQLYPHMCKIVPMPSIYDPDFIAANQEARANNVINGTKQECLDQIRKDIRNFKTENGLDKVLVIWTANTERFADISPGVNDTSANLLNSISVNHPEVFYY